MPMAASPRAISPKTDNTCMLKRGQAPGAGSPRVGGAAPRDGLPGRRPPTGEQLEELLRAIGEGVRAQAVVDVDRSAQARVDPEGRDQDGNNTWPDDQVQPW